MAETPHNCKGPESPADIATELRARVRDIRENGPPQPVCLGQALALRIAAHLESQSPKVVDAIHLIEMERKQQIERGFNAQHDDDHCYAQLAIAAAFLAAHETDARVEEPTIDDGDPWGLVSKYKGNRIQQLVIAGALLAAEIERLLRLEAAKLRGPNR